ncbi:MAG: hypothetical protein E4G96_09205 [Chrysiogenales bacterium]|nr:MAG: hypothetical protein E4G96_09205 [Chrysiogenales bacterium]
MIREAHAAADVETSATNPGKRPRLFKLPFLKQNASSPKGPSFSFAPAEKGRASLQAQSSGGFTIQGFFTACAEALVPRKLIIAASAVVIASMLLFCYNRLITMIFSSADIGRAEFIKSIVHITPLALLFFIYLAAASVISSLSMDGAGPQQNAAPRIALRYLVRSIGSVFIASVSLFIATIFIFMLFGAIPVIGPLLFAILFLPLYAVSLCMIILFAVGFWFYPPIVASSGPGPRAAMRAFFVFIRRHGPGLAYAVPILSIVTAASFSVIFILHKTAVSIALFISKNLIALNTMTTSDATISPLLSLSDLAMIGTDAGAYGSIITAVLSATTPGGVILASALSLISIMLFAIFISLTATLSAHAYVMMERNGGSDDAGAIRLLLLSLLFLAGILLVKKLFF